MKMNKMKMSHNHYYKLGKFEYFGGFKVGDFRLLSIVTKSVDEMQARFFEFDGWCIVQRVGENVYFPVTPFFSALQEVFNNGKK